jgi:hypothetical protein
MSFSKLFMIDDIKQYTDDEIERFRDIYLKYNPIKDHPVDEEEEAVKVVVSSKEEQPRKRSM